MARQESHTHILGPGCCSRYGRRILLTSPCAHEVKIIMSNRNESVSRRQFIRNSSAAVIAATAVSSAAVAGANEKVIIGVMGTSRSGNNNGRGASLAVEFAGNK